MSIDVIALPGGVMPASLRYASLSAALGDSVRLHAKDLEVYAGDSPPNDYSVQLEIDALAAYADSLGLRRFHLLAYSGGGFISLAFAGAYPDRLLSLALFESAGIPGTLSPEESEQWTHLQQGLAGLSGAEFMRAFVTLQVRDGVVVPPPDGPPPPWMAKRPAGIAALIAAFDAHPFDRDLLRRATFPVFYGYGDLTSVQEEVRAGTIARLFADIHVRRFSGVHHFVSAEAIYSAEHVELLRELWVRAEGRA
ncbi:MAG TPA: alpha/beta hydrolase [Candidatus Dormibacteraeota bacterium]|nr:alpha/beta hydrolase [Candidatus Dormibacteraeota bacterium]